MSTSKQVEANRSNGLKGGVKSEEGKAISRLNARKHGIFAVALTPEDSEEAAGIEDELIASMRPVGRVEEMLVEKIALTYLRMQRCARAEAEFHIETWREPNKKLAPYAWEQLQEQRRSGGRGSTFRENVFERMVKLIDLYDARLTNQWLKLLREFERQQALRLVREREAGRRNDVAQPRSPSESAARRVPVRAYEEAPDSAAQAEAPAPQTPQTEDITQSVSPNGLSRNYLPASSQAPDPAPQTPHEKPSQVAEGQRVSA